MALQVQGLTKEFPTPSGPLHVLRGIDLTLQPGEALAIMGPSGSGKSTLLYILGTLDTPTSGTVRIGGKDPFALGDAELARFRNRSLGFVFQDHHLLPQCTVLENVLLPTLVGLDDGPLMRQRGTQLLQRVGLGERLDHRPAELSGGERQRVSVARALIHKPTLVLADEPTGNLDRRSGRTIGELLLSLCREENSILITVTHSAELAATFPTTRVMEDGKLVEARP
jgi:lipoprotein-releasing system ATP-binding protein